MMLHAGWMGNLVLRPPRITLIDRIWAVLCHAYEIPSIQTGSLSHYANVLDLGLKSRAQAHQSPSSLLVSGLCVCACVRAYKTNKWITWIGFSRWAHCSVVSGGLCWVYDYEFKSRRWQHKQACGTTKVCCFCVLLFRTTAVKLSSYRSSFSVTKGKFSYFQWLPVWLWTHTNTHNKWMMWSLVFPCHRLKP